uniref:Potassium channel domain-containing protein n=1 Tax=Meloidogyne javanica TaxID=6303 RepID=A0A915ND83_MELJA
MTLFTTIGYGTIACQTALGKFASIVYALFGIPMMLMVLGDVGQLILGFLLYCRKSVREYYRRWLLRAYVSDIIIEEDIESKIFLATALPLNFLQDEKQQNNLNNTTNQRHKRCRSKSMNAVGD